MMGDFNININKASNKDRKNLINSFNSFGLKQLIKETTRYGSRNSCTDLIFTNSDYISDSGTLDLNFSDHQAVYEKARDSASRVCATTKLLSDSSDVTVVTIHYDIIKNVTQGCF